MKSNVLVIKLGALGDLTLCFRAFQAIRDAHADADIALLTSPAFAKFASDMPWFDRVLLDSRPPFWRLDAWLRLRSQVAAIKPSRVYDLQGKFRQAALLKLLGGAKKIEWSGAAKGCSHPRLWPPSPDMHYTDFISAQLERAGIGDFVNNARPDLSWLDGDVEEFRLPGRYAALIPGCAPDRPYKRWPAAKYAELSEALAEKGVACVVIGGAADSDAANEIAAKSKNALNLCGKTSLKQVAALARRAEFVVGNDTGPTHIAAAVGARTVALMSDRVNPVWSAPKGDKTSWIQGSPLENLEVSQVLRSVY